MLETGERQREAIEQVVGQRQGRAALMELALRVGGRPPRGRGQADWPKRGTPENSHQVGERAEGGNHQHEQQPGVVALTASGVHDERDMQKNTQNE